MMNTQKIRITSAFTLLETMVAVLILGMAIAAMHSTWMAILGATKSGARATRHIQRERVALSQMELALNCAVIYYNEDRQNQGLTNAYSFVAENIDGFYSVSFAARLPEDFLGSSHFPHQPIRRVTLGVERVGDRNDLIMRQWQLTKVERAMEEGDEGLAITLAQDVDLFEARFWSLIVEDYVEDWEDQSDVLPKRMRLFLALRDEEGEVAGPETLNMREFALVSDVIDEENISPEYVAPRRSPSGDSRGREFDWSKLPKQIRDRIDTNKDGRLSDSEKRKASEDYRKRQGGGRGQGGRGPVKAVRPSPGGSKGGGFRGTIVGPGGSGGSGGSGRGGGKK